MAESLTVTKTFNAGPKEVFEALVNPEQMSKWFFPDPSWSAEVQSDPKVGGAYRVAMDTKNGNIHVMEGVYRIVDKPTKLEYTWNAAMEAGKIVDSIVSITLKAVQGGTELTLVHSELPTKKSADNHAQGWDGCLANLDRSLA